MKNTIILVLLTLFFLFKQSKGQLPIGKYKDGNRNYIHFMSNNKIEFLLPTPTGLGTYLMSCYGEYELEKNKIVIKAMNKYMDNSLSYSLFNPVENRNLKEFKIFAYDKNGNDLNEYVFLEYFINGKVVNGGAFNTITLSFGILPDDSLIYLIRPSYESVNIKINSDVGGDFKVYFHKGQFDFINTNNKFFIPYNLTLDTLYCIFNREYNKLKLIKEK